MEPSTKHAAHGFMFAVLIVTSVCVAVNYAMADGPSRENLKDLEDIKKNQIVLKETRPYYDNVVFNASQNIPIDPNAVEPYNRFLEAKAWNEAEVKKLASDGWCVEWSSLQLVQCPKPAEKKPVSSAKVTKSPTSVNLDKLAKAVARHETGDCTAPVGSALVNNCFGIVSYTGGRHFKRYATKEESYEDFKRIWATYYKRFPDLAMARKYSGNDRAEQWLANVTSAYNSL